MTTPNPYRGEAVLSIEGKSYTLAFTFTAFAKMKAIFGDTDINKPLQEMDFPKIAQILECGLAKHHPNMTSEKIMDMNVPLMPALHAIRESLHYSITGGQEVEKEPKGPPGSAARKKTA